MNSIFFGSYTISLLMLLLQLSHKYIKHPLGWVTVGPDSWTSHKTVDVLHELDNTEIH